VSATGQGDGNGRALLIGCGNTLRRDDGIGWSLAERVAAWDAPGIDVLTVHQLTPELAPRVAAAGRLLVIDAVIAGTGAPIRLEPLEAPAADTTGPLSHGFTPPALLELAAALYGRRPPAWQLLVPASDLGFGPELSATTAARIPAALNAIRELLALPAPLHA
jgi:hydrogenase maturation protease